MKSAFATTWNRSVQPRKQRKYAYNAPYHVKGKLLSATLSKELKEKHGKNSLRVKTGDKVKVMRGNNKGREGKVERVDVERSLVYITKMETSKTDGSKAAIAIHPSNLTITELDLNDKKRQAKTQAQAKKE